MDDKEVEELGPAVGHVHEARKVDENGEQGGNEGEEDQDEVVVPDEPPEDAWFIPLGWARQCPPVLYKGSDPEWQSFVAFSKDKQRGLSVRSRSLRKLCLTYTNSNPDELAGLVGKHLAGMKGFQMVLGTPIQTRKFWLDVDFPDGPPPEYERGG